MRFLPRFVSHDEVRLADFATTDNTTPSTNAVGTEEARSRDSDTLITDEPLGTGAVGNFTRGETGSADDVWEATTSRNTSLIFCKKSSLAIAPTVPNWPIVESIPAFTHPCTPCSNLASTDDQ